GGAFVGAPSTLTFRSTRSESIRIVSTGSWQSATLLNRMTTRKILAQRRKGAKKDAKLITLFFAPLRLCARNFVKNLIRIVTTFAARDCVSAIHADANSSPSSITRAVGWAISQAVH